MEIPAQMNNHAYTVDTLIERVLENYDFAECKAVDVSGIQVKQEIRDLCKKNTCGHYGNNYMCPPAINDLNKWQTEIQSYNSGIMMTKVYPIKSSFDLEGMLAGGKQFGKLMVRVNEKLNADYPELRFLCLGAGACPLCKTCTIVVNEPCRFPDRAIPSIEACGIDVMSLSIQAGVRYNNGNNTVTYLGLILFNQ